MPLKYYKISHQRDQCIGCGSCVVEAPQTWTLDTEDGLSMCKGSKNKNGTYVKSIDEMDYEDNLRAAQSCPVGVIRVDESA